MLWETFFVKNRVKSIKDRVKSIKNRVKSIKDRVKTIKSRTGNGNAVPLPMQNNHLFRIRRKTQKKSPKSPKKSPCGSICEAKLGLGATGLPADGLFPPFFRFFHPFSVFFFLLSLLYALLNRAVVAEFLMAFFLELIFWRRGTEKNN